MTVLTFTVYGVALAKGNMRAFQGKGMAFPVVTESNRSVKSWQQLVAEGASRALQNLPLEQRTMFANGVRLTVAFFLPRPKKYKKRGVFVAHCTKPDTDKLIRAVLDALTAVVFHDDKQVTEIVAGKYYADVEAPARVHIRVEAAPALAMECHVVRDQPLFEALSE